MIYCASKRQTTANCTRMVGVIWMKVWVDLIYDLTKGEIAIGTHMCGRMHGSL